MIGFDDLTPVGRLRRLRRVAAQALELYNFDDYQFTLLADSFNTLYRVMSTRGTFVLRVGPQHRIHPVGAARAEADWTEQLAASGVRAPRVIGARDGSASVTVTSAGVPGPRECTLLSWTPGQILERPIGVEEARALASVCAQLHTVSVYRAIRPRGVLDGRSALLFDIPDRLGDVGVSHRALFSETLMRAQRGIDDLWKGAVTPARLVHGDLTPNNVLRNRRGFVAVDFQDMTWGYEQQDLANTMFGIARDDTGGELARAFRSTYETRRPWPDLDGELLADLFAARRLTMVNLALTMQRPGLSEYIEGHATALRDYVTPKRRRRQLAVRLFLPMM